MGNTDLLRQTLTDQLFSETTTLTDLIGAVGQAAETFIVSRAYDKQLDHAEAQQALRSLARTYRDLAIYLPGPRQPPMGAIGAEDLKRIATFLRDHASSTESGMRAEALELCERTETAVNAALVLPRHEAEGYAQILQAPPRDPLTGYSDQEQSDRDSASSSLAELVLSRTPQPS
jgi:hypothetical protein